MKRKRFTEGNQITEYRLKQNGELSIERYDKKYSEELQLIILEPELTKELKEFLQ